MPRDLGGHSDAVHSVAWKGNLLAAAAGTLKVFEVVGSLKPEKNRVISCQHDAGCDAICDVSCDVACDVACDVSLCAVAALQCLAEDL